MTLDHNLVDIKPEEYLIQNSERRTRKKSFFQVQDNSFPFSKVNIRVDSLPSELVKKKSLD